MSPRMIVPLMSRETLCAEPDVRKRWFCKKLLLPGRLFRGLLQDHSLTRVVEINPITFQHFHPDVTRKPTARGRTFEKKFCLRPINFQSADEQLRQVTRARACSAAHPEFTARLCRLHLDQ